MSQSSAPNNQDLVLGGQSPPPIGGAVLGGLPGLSLRFDQIGVDQKIATLAESAIHGIVAFPLIQRGLEDADLNVRKAAYIHLSRLNPTDPVVERGIPLNIGDRIYAVYESAIYYGDDWYYISSELNESDESDEWEDNDPSIYQTREDPQGQPFTLVSVHPESEFYNDYDEYSPHLVAFYFDLKEAESKAQVVYQARFSDLGCEIHEMDLNSSHDDFNLQDWVELNKVLVTTKFQEEWDESDWAYECDVLTSLQRQNKLDLLFELWQLQGYEPLAFVHEHVIDRTCYFRP